MLSSRTHSRLALLAALALGALLLLAAPWRSLRASDDLHAAERVDPHHRWHLPGGDCSCAAHGAAARVIRRRSRALDRARAIDSD